MKKQHVQLSESDRQYLESLIATGELPVKVHRRALALLDPCVKLEGVAFWSTI